MLCPAAVLEQATEIQEWKKSTNIVIEIKPVKGKNKDNSNGNA